MDALAATWAVVGLLLLWVCGCTLWRLANFEK